MAVLSPQPETMRNPATPESSSVPVDFKWDRARECTKWWVVFPKPTLAGLAFKNCCLARRIDFTEICSGSEEGSYLRPIDLFITQL